MSNWLASLLFAGIAFGLTSMVGSLFGFRESTCLVLSLLLWALVGALYCAKTEFGDDVSESEIAPTPAAPSTPESDPSLNNQSLHVAVVELAKQLRTKEMAIDKLQAKLSEREFRRSLSRLATINETLAFTLKLLRDGKLSHTDAVDQLRQEIESAIGDLGIDYHAIQVGAAISSLPPGSFVILKSEDATDPAAAGTVKEVISTGLFAKDEDGKPHFISPSKIHAYKL